MQPLLQEETRRLVRSWDQHAPSWLAAYLVAGVEDPRINLQSILSRHFLIQEPAGDRHGDLMQQEYRFAASMNWLMKLARRKADPEEVTAIQYALKKGADNAEGLEIPLFLVQTYAQLPCSVSGLAVPNYIEDFLTRILSGEVGGPQASLETFQRLWREALAPGRFETQDGSDASPVVPAFTRMSLLEPACGSANDYRFLHAYGVAEWFDYVGFDLCQTNIENAQSLFPLASFRVGNVFEIDAGDKAYDLCLAHDLLEHLSLEGMETAVREICRVTRRGICIGFFQMDEIREHVVRAVDEYHWNLLSMAKMRELFARQGFTGHVIHIGSFLDQQVGCEETHNPNAYTFVLRASS